MGVTATQVEIARGIAMPFVPMRARVGTPIRTPAQVKSAVAELEDDRMIIQPVLTGKRVCLAVVDRNVFIQDDRGKWVATPPANGHDFLKLPNNTCLDGYIARNTFYSADCLAIRGQSLLRKSAAERETVTYQLCKFLRHDWLFRRPSPKFIKAARQNLPGFQGLTLKDYLGFYSFISSGTEEAKSWLKRLW